MDIINDILNVNKEISKKTLKSFRKNWIIIFTGVVYTFLNILLFTIIGSFFTGPLFILSGIAVALVTSSLLSNYLYILFNIINYDRFNYQIFKDGFTYFIRKIYSILFIGYFARLILSLLTGGGRGIPASLFTLLYFGLFIFLNPLPEAIYLKVYSPMDTIKKSYEFISENFLNWFIPNIVFFSLIYIVTGNIISGLFNTHLSLGNIFSIDGIIKYLLGQVIFSFGMIYRGYLYKLLSTSNRRKRQFMSKF